MKINFFINTTISIRNTPGKCGGRMCRDVCGSEFIQKKLFFFTQTGKINRNFARNNPMEAIHPHSNDCHSNDSHSKYMVRFCRQNRIATYFRRNSNISPEFHWLTLLRIFRTFYRKSRNLHSNTPRIWLHPDSSLSPANNIWNT